MAQRPRAPWFPSGWTYPTTSRITRSHTDSQQTSSPTYIGPRKQPGALGPTPLDISITHHSRCHIRCLHTSLLEHHPTTLVPHPTGQSKVRPIRKSTTTHLEPVPQHGHKGLEEERILQPTRVHFTTTAGCLQRRVTTSKGTKSHSIEFTFTTHHSQPAGVHLQLVHTFRLPHGPTSHSPDEVARDTCRTSADRGEPPKSLHTKPRFYRTPERMVGCHHTLPLQPFPLQESKLQISDTELTLVTHHGQQLPETRGLLMPKMPWDIQAFLRHLTQQKHWRTCPSQTMFSHQSASSTQRQRTSCWRTTAGINWHRAHLPLFSHAMAWNRHTVPAQHHETNHSRPAGRLDTGRRQSTLLTQQADGPPPENTTTTIHETGSMDTEQHSRDPKQKHTSRIRQVQTWLASQDLECQDGLPWVLLWLFHLCVYGRDSNSRTPWSHRFDVFDVHSNLSLRNDQTAQPNHQETQSSLNIWADIFSRTPQHHLVCDGVYFLLRISLRHEVTSMWVSLENLNTWTWDPPDIEWNTSSNEESPHMN